MRQWFIALFLLVLAGGCSAPSILVTPVSNPTGLVEEEVQPGKGLGPGKIVIIPVEGMLINSRKPGLLEPGENAVSLITQQLQKAEKDNDVKAIVLRLNSGGGTVTSSDTIYRLIQDFRKKTHKPVIASVQEVAASGAYYVACGTDQIVAQPTSIVGSIGVIFTTFDVVGTMDKIGVQTYTVKSGQLKDMGSPFKPLTPAEREVIQSMINEDFARFRNIVQTNRKLTDEQTTAVSDGRVFSGEQAKVLNLVDRLGSLEDALDLAREKANARGASAVLYMRPYGYGGSIYASNELPTPEARGSATLSIAGIREMLPTLSPGFYYYWQP